MHRQNLPCDLYGSRLVRRRDRRKQAGLVQRQQFPSCLPHGGSREQERVHEQQFERKFAVVVVACRRLRVLLLQRPRRLFLWRDELGPRYLGYYGVRPLCNLSSGILVSDRPDSDGAYTIIWNRAPSKPSSITVPSSVRGGESLSISWGASTDEDGNLSGYILERQVNGGAWAQVYKGINRSYTDAITFGWTSIAYRVKAYDSAGAESAYQTSATRTVVNNHAPVISGTDSNLGTKTAAFAQSYSATDEDSGQTLTVTEYIDGTQKRSYTATSGQTYSFNITAAEWVKLLNGSHTLKIVAADNYGGSATRTYTFTKNETEIELTLATPLTADDMVTKGIMSVVRQIPAGAKFTVEVCNNGNDASPTWEDVTQNVVSGSKFFLSNTTKTASAWGYNFRIKVKRGTATGDCFITSAGGNFE